MKNTKIHLSHGDPNFELTLSLKLYLINSQPKMHKRYTLVWNDMSWVTIKETLSNIHLIISLQQLDLNGYDP